MEETEAYIYLEELKQVMITLTKILVVYIDGTRTTFFFRIKAFDEYRLFYRLYGIPVVIESSSLVPIGVRGTRFFQRMVPKVRPGVILLQGILPEPWTPEKYSSLLSYFNIAKF